MAGKSPVTATPEQRAGLESKAWGPDRAEADRARAVLLTLRGWTSARIAEAFGVREDTVRFLARPIPERRRRRVGNPAVAGASAAENASGFARRRASAVDAGDEPGPLGAGPLLGLFLSLGEVDDLNASGMSTGAYACAAGIVPATKRAAEAALSLARLLQSDPTGAPTTLLPRILDHQISSTFRLRLTISPSR